MKVAGVHATSLADGKGVNYVLFAQGCDVHCDGCQNPSTWDKDGGVEMTVEEIEADILRYVPPVTGVTFSGGESSLQIGEVAKIARWAKENGLTTTLYTGKRIDYLLGSWGFPKDSPFDVIIDSPFEIDKFSRECPFRGSTNQRIFKKQGNNYYRVEIDNKGNII